METPPKIESKENYDSMISLRFFRHGDRDKLISEDDQKKLEILIQEGWKGEKDYLIKLNQVGRKQAHEAGDIKSDISQSVAFGGPRERSAETAMRTMVGPDSDFGGENHSFSDLLKNLDQDRGLGSKVGFDERLNYIIDQNEVTGKELVKNISAGHGLEWLVKESDRIAEENGDKNTSTYSRLASNIAKLIEKYYKVSDRWNELVEQGTIDYDKKLKRFLGTHGTIVESFLAKIIEKKEGRERRDEFLKFLGGNGFDFVEGINVDISHKDGKKIIKIKYSKENSDGKKFDFNSEISPEIISEIIKEGSDI